MKYYDSSKRCFRFKIKNTEKEIEMFIPSIGVSQAVYNHVIEASRKNVNVDEGFIQVAPFLFEDWRDLKYETFINKMRQSDYWTKEEYSVYFTLSEKIKLGTKMDVSQTCPVCGDREVTADISFPDGIRSLFVISDIFRELL
jgi:dimeric dUTPase (all-alpha-NTP-PPase superfamily)